MTPYYRDDALGVRLYLGDCLEVMPATGERGQFFVIDPPYARAGAMHTGRRDTGARNDKLDADQFWHYWFRDVAVALAAQTDRCGVTFTDFRTMDLVERAFGDARCRGWSTPQALVWDREALGLGTPFRASHEMLAFSRGPAFKWEGPYTIPNVVRCRWPYGKKPNHPAEKPVALVRRFVEWFTAPGETVQDWFCGGGSSLIAALQLGRLAVGCDADEASCETTAKRLEALRLELVA